MKKIYTVYRMPIGRKRSAREWVKHMKECWKAFEGNDFLEHKFISIVRSGRSPLVEGAMPDRLKS